MLVGMSGGNSTIVQRGYPRGCTGRSNSEGCHEDNSQKYNRGHDCNHARMIRIIFHDLSFQARRRALSVTFTNFC